MSKQPKLMNFTRMRNIIEPHAQHLSQNIFINKELAVLHGDSAFFRLIIRQEPPFSIDDHRLGIILSGEAHINLNLVDRRFLPGSLVFIGPGSIITPFSFSDDLRIMGVGLSNEFTMPFALGQPPATFNGQIRDFLIPASEEDRTTACDIIETIWHVVHQPAYSRPTVGYLVAALLNHYHEVHQLFSSSQAHSRTREQSILDRFLSLVNQHSASQHSLAFYAGQMCLTERYLGTVIRKTSGTTAKEWIDKSLTDKVKLMLRHSDLPINQIAEEMNFANPSFFNKFFKRMTGTTPFKFRTDT